MIRAENEITLVRVDDGLDGKMSAEQIAQLNQASADASQAKTDASTAKTTAETAQDDAQTAQGMTTTLGEEFSDFKENDYAQAIDNIKDELSKELVAQKFARIENGSLILGETNGTTAILQNKQFGFYTPNSGVPASYFGKDDDAWAFNIERGIIKNDLRFNGFRWISRANRNMSLKWLK